MNYILVQKILKSESKLQRFYHIINRNNKLNEYLSNAFSFSISSKKYKTSLLKCYSQINICAYTNSVTH